MTFKDGLKIGVKITGALASFAAGVGAEWVATEAIEPYYNKTIERAKGKKYEQLKTLAINIGVWGLLGAAGVISANQVEKITDAVLDVIDGTKIVFDNVNKKG